MSQTARYHAKLWAEGKSASEIQEEITALEAAPVWQGIEFDDVRVNHMRRTRIETLRNLLRLNTMEVA